MTRKLFGTDGVRGTANTELSPMLALDLGLAAAHVLRRTHQHPVFVVGRDTRLSSPMLTAAISAGLCAMGGKVIDLEILPTPAVACITRHIGADAGVVISASHNPFSDNGIKFFGHDGFKLDDTIELQIEQTLVKVQLVPRPSGAEVGRIEISPHLVDIYVSHLRESMNTTVLDGLRVVVDGANGADSFLAPSLFKSLGATVTCINCAPDGVNINHDCGALHPKALQARVTDDGADFGVAFDGDGDRAMLCDETGAVVDGDRVMSLCARSLSNQGLLTGNTVVATIMSNMGLEASLALEGISLLRTAVGDRYVSEAMRSNGFILGGEKSGHLIFGHLTTTGDGLLTTLQVLKVMRETGKTLSELASVMVDYPQMLISVKVVDRLAWQNDAVIGAALEEAIKCLGSQGRVNIRASGTEKLVRVMVEGSDSVTVTRIADDLSTLVRQRWGA